MKKVLVVDDSALMRRVLCDIIEQDKRFQVVANATNGLEALELLKKNTYDVVVLDVNMPKMNGLELLKELQKNKIAARVVMASTDTKEGAKTTLDALELGALDFVHKPTSALECRRDLFRTRLLQILSAVTESRAPSFTKAFSMEDARASKKMVDLVSRHAGKVKGNKVVAIASSTGGPKALQSVVPRIPSKLNAPVVIVQHMPAGFTASLAERLNSLSEAEVKEAAEGDVLLPGKVYIAKGGMHLKIRYSGGRHVVYYSDEPPREGGQTVDIDYVAGLVYVDGQPLDEPYLPEEMYLPGPTMQQTHWEVPEGSIFVMGDNRNHSTDSRDIQLGPIDTDYILGRAVLALWPSERFGAV